MANDSPVALVHRSATRRKACTGCVKAKRRCDLTLPGCMRCRTRNLRCVYVNGETSERSSPEHGRIAASASFPSTPESPDTLATINAGMSPPSSVDSLGPIDRWFETANSMSSMNPFDAPFHFFTFPEHGTLSNRQTNYLVTQFKSSIKSFVLDSQTPFIHPLLYKETWPTVYQDALGVCSLYIQKTPRNREAVFRTLDCKVAALVQASTAMLSSVEDNLLALQALILYQVIRLFDGDVRQRANAERHMQLLDSWTLRLQQNYFQALETPATEPMYDRWVLVESIRRATMVSVVLRSLYCAMKDGYCELVPLLCTMPVSSTGKLWKTTETDWQEQKSCQEVLTYTEFTQKWNAGNVSGVDEYEKLLLVLCRHASGTGDFQPS